MLINDQEYQQMFTAETNLWWYKILHEKVFEQIKNYSPDKKINILDAGCGTGGLITFLQKKGYENITGFDFSETAVNFCKLRKLDVHHADITTIDTVNTPKFDIIICNDVIYQFENETITNIFSNFSKILKTKGIIISNNQAFNVFSGTHDIAVGAKQRFTIQKIQKIIQDSASNLVISSHNYWSFLLSPLILIVRISQKIRLKFKLISLENVKSDVELPSNFINNLFYNIVKLEERLIKKAPFGSSLFMVLKAI